MKDRNKTKEQLMGELVDLRRRIPELEASETERKKAMKVQTSLYKISEAAHSAENLEELYRSIHNIINELMPAKNNFYIAIYDEASEMLDFPYFVDEHEGNPGPQKLGKGLIEYVLRTGKPLLASPEVFDELEKKGEVESVGPPSIDWLGVPLKTNNKTIGVMAGQIYTEGVRYSEEHKNILMFVSTQVAMAMEGKQAEEALKKTTVFIDIMGDALMVLDSQARMIKVNKVFSNLWGYTPNEVLGKPVFGMFTKEESPKHKSEMEKAVKEGGVRIFETIALTKDKKEINVSVVGIVLKDEKGKLHNFIALFRDIIERKRSEESLRESEEKYRTILESIEEGYYEVDLTGNFTFFNDSLCRMLGYSKDELMGMNNREYMVEKSAKKVYKIFNKIYKTGIPAKSLDFQIIQKGGAKMDGEISISLIKGSRNEPIGFRGIVHDITERKKAEMVLKDREQQIKSSLKEKEVLLKEIHHRVKNNMQIISSLLRLQSRQIKDEEILEMFNQSQNRIRSMALIHEELYKSKDLARIDFSDYINRLTSHLFSAYEAGMRNIDFKIQVKDVYLDINRAIPCGLIIGEIVSNSLKHAFPDGKGGEIFVKMHTDKKDKHALMIKDTGVGIPEGLDFHKTETLGMQLVTDLVQQLDGNIELRRNKGTEFKITFNVPK